MIAPILNALLAEVKSEDEVRQCRSGESLEANESGENDVKEEKGRSSRTFR